MDAIKPKERRLVTRQAGDTIEPVRLRLEEGAVVAKVQDISVVGFAARTRHVLEPGTWIVVEPGEASRCLSPELRAEVKHTIKYDNLDYLVGCHFNRFLTADDLLALGGAFSTA